MRESLTFLCQTLADLFLSVGSADRDISNDNTSLEPLPKIYTGDMSPIRIPSPSLGGNSSL